MGTRMKINLEAIMKSQTVAEDTVATKDEKKSIVTPIIVEKKNDSTIPLIVEEKNESDTTLIVEKEDKSDDTLIVEEEKEWEDKKVFITLDNIQKNSKINKWEWKNKLNEKEPLKLPIIKKIEENIVKQELFSNYEGAFAKKDDSIMKKIKKLKSLPKTRPLFVSSLIIMTIIWIWWIFYIDPKNHSFDSYKTSVINAFDGNNLIYEAWLINDNYQQTISLTSEIKKIQIWWLSFEFEIEIINNKEVFNFNWKTYNSKAELKKVITIEVEKIKKEKLINGLIKSF